MTRPHILYYAQDPGGTRYLDPVITALWDEQIFDWSIMLHPFAKSSALMGEKYAGNRVAFWDQMPAPKSYFEDVIDDLKPDAIVSTTSAQARDASNGMLIATAKGRNIPCMAGLDHWKGLDRFFEDRQPRYFPDQLICIDEVTKTALGEAGLDTSGVHAIGHPGLEHIERNASAPNTIPWRILLISQPIVQASAYHGIYDERVGDHRLMDNIADVLGSDINDGAIEVYLRKHPKDHAGGALPAGIRIDDISDWNRARAHYDVFVGFDSMALIEASLAGAPCVRLALPELADVSDRPVPLEYGVPTMNLNDLPRHIRKAVSESNTPGPNPFSGSTARAADTIRSFVNSII